MANAIQTAIAGLVARPYPTPRTRSVRTEELPARMDVRTGIGITSRTKSTEPALEGLVLIREKTDRPTVTSIGTNFSTEAG